MTTTAVFIIVFFALIPTLLLVRALLRRQWRASSTRNKADQRVLIVLGSGGHTTEMLRLIDGLTKLFDTRLFLTADERSRAKVCLLEISFENVYRVFCRQSSMKLRTAIKMRIYMRLRAVEALVNHILRL